MKNRVIAGVVALAVVLALVGLAVMAGRDSGSKAPATLPVLGAAGGAEASSSADSPMGMRRAGPVRYEARGKLPGLDAEADAYELAAPAADLERFAALAHDLGVDGKVTRTEFGWTVVDGADRLDVQRVAGLPWSRYQADPSVGTVEPGGKGVAGSSGSASGSSAPSAPSKPSGSSGPDTIVCGSPCPPNAECIVADCPTESPVEEPSRPADLPTKAEAERIGRKLLTELGVDLDHAIVGVDDGFSVWNVNADPEVGGRPVVGMTTSVGVGPKGEVTYANGWLGEPVKGDRYPLIGTAAGIEKLGQDQVRMLGAPEPLIAPAPDCAADGPCATPPVSPDCLPDAECRTVSTIEAEPVVVRITGVRLGLQLFSTYEPGQPAYLVPTYLFQTEDAGVLPAIAVDDKYLAPSPGPVEPEGGTKGEVPGDPGTTVEGGDTPGSGVEPTPIEDPGPATTEPVTTVPPTTTEPSTP